MTRRDDLTRAHFDAAAAYWREVYTGTGTFTGYSLRCVHDAVLARVAAYSRKRGGRLRVLDAGCGAGITAAELATHGHQVSACDIAPRMVATARQVAQDAGADVNVLVASAEGLPYPAAAFDVVIALGLVSNLRDDRALCEFYRVLKPGGLLLLTAANLAALDVWAALPGSLPILLNTTPLRRPARIAANGLRRLMGRVPKDPDAIRFGRSMVPPLYLRTLHQHGFIDVRYSALSYGPFVPLGLWRWPDSRSIAASQRITQTPVLRDLLRPFGTAMLFSAHRHPCAESRLPL